MLPRPLPWSGQGVLRCSGAVLPWSGVKELEVMEEVEETGPPPPAGAGCPVLQPAVSPRARRWGEISPRKHSLMSYFTLALVGHLHQAPPKDHTPCVL